MYQLTCNSSGRLFTNSSVVRVESKLMMSVRSIVDSESDQETMIKEVYQSAKTLQH